MSGLSMNRRGMRGTGVPFAAKPGAFLAFVPLFFPRRAAASNGKVLPGPRSIRGIPRAQPSEAVRALTRARGVCRAGGSSPREVSPLITFLPAAPRRAETRAHHSFPRCNLQRPLNASMNEVGKLLEYRSAGCVHTRWVRKREPSPSPTTSETRAAVDQNQF